MISFNLKTKTNKYYISTNKISNESTYDAIFRASNIFCNKNKLNFINCKVSDVETFDPNFDDPCCGFTD